MKLTNARIIQQVKNEDRTEMEESLASGVQFLQSLVQVPSDISASPSLALMRLLPSIITSGLAS